MLHTFRGGAGTAWLSVNAFIGELSKEQVLAVVSVDIVVDADVGTIAKGTCRGLHMLQN